MVYDDMEPQALRDNEIGPHAVLLHAPDARVQAGPVYHQGADYSGSPEVTVTVVDGHQCVHEGRVYTGGEALAVPRAVADFLVRSGWATPTEEPDSEPEPEPEPPVKAAAKAPTRRAAPGRRTR